MQALCHFIVVVIKIQAGGAEVEFVGFFLIANPGSQDGMDTGTEGRFMNCPGLVEIKVPLEGIEDKKNIIFY